MRLPPPPLAPPPSLLSRLAAHGTACALSLLLVAAPPIFPALAAELSPEQKLVASAWKKVDQEYVDRTFAGQDWFTVRQKLVKQNYASRDAAYDEIRGMLGKLGYQVKTVNNAETALALLEQESFDLILMDCMMPELDGFTATRTLREREQAAERTRTPVIAITANTAEGGACAPDRGGLDPLLAGWGPNALPDQCGNEAFFGLTELRANEYQFSR